MLDPCYCEICVAIGRGTIRPVMTEGRPFVCPFRAAISRTNVRATNFAERSTELPAAETLTHAEQPDTPCSSALPTSPGQSTPQVAIQPESSHKTDDLSSDPGEPTESHPEQRPVSPHGFETETQTIHEQGIQVELGNPLESDSRGDYSRRFLEPDSTVQVNTPPQTPGPARSTRNDSP